MTALTRTLLPSNPTLPSTLPPSHLTHPPHQQLPISPATSPSPRHATPSIHPSSSPLPPLLSSHPAPPRLRRLPRASNPGVKTVAPVPPARRSRTRPPSFFFFRHSAFGVVSRTDRGGIGESGTVCAGGRAAREGRGRKKKGRGGEVVARWGIHGGV